MFLDIVTGIGYARQKGYLIDKSNIILPDVSKHPYSVDTFLDEDTFVNCLDKIMRNSNSVYKSVCTTSSFKVVDYFVELNMADFLVKIPKNLKAFLDICKEDPFVRYYVIPVKLIFPTEPEQGDESNRDYIAHSNILLVDNLNLKIEFFEPHGVSFDSHVIDFNIESTVRNIVQNLFPKRSQVYSFENVHSLCPVGPQSLESTVDSTGGYCLAWSLLYVHLRIMNTNKKHQDIITFLTGLPPIQLNNYIKRYLSLLKTGMTTVKQYDSFDQYKIIPSSKQLELIKKRIHYLLKLYMTSDYNKRQIFSELITYRKFDFFHSEFISFFNTKNSPRDNSKKRKIEEINADELLKAYMKL